MLSEVTSFPLPDSLPPLSGFTCLQAQTDGVETTSLVTPVGNNQTCLLFGAQRFETALINMFFRQEPPWVHRKGLL